MIGPNGEKRSGDTIKNALHVAKLATGEAEEVYVDESKQPGGQKGGRVRADALTPEQRRQIAESGAAARWGREG
jgi:hypothetical protein